MADTDTATADAPMRGSESVAPSTPSTHRRLSLASIPADVLEEILLSYAFANPSADAIFRLAAPLLQTCRTIRQALDIELNPSPYARIFTLRFDTSLAHHRLRWIPPLRARPLASEFKLRCQALNAFRSRCGASLPADGCFPDPYIEQYLWTAYLMVLEHELHNIPLLRDFAMLPDWLFTYLFSSSGGSRFGLDITGDKWPLITPSSRLAMWLNWFLQPFDQSNAASRVAQRIVKTFALGAHKYDLTDIRWQSLSSSSPAVTGLCRRVRHYDDVRDLVAPPIVPPATLSFLAMVNLGSRYPALSIPYNICDPTWQSRNHWEAEWLRTSDLQTSAWAPGSAEGVWEGAFTYMDFNDFTDLRHQAPPHKLQNAFIAQNEQIWNLREYHFIPIEEVDPTPLPLGNVLAGFIPEGCQITTRSDDILIREPGKTRGVRYLQWKSGMNCSESRDIIVVGAGHSNWGRFALRGRVRKADGFLTLLKEYGDGPRGRWIYRGYIVGHPDGNFVGRWRDTITPSMDYGYEGCFALTRRR